MLSEFIVFCTADTLHAIPKSEIKGIELNLNSNKLVIKTYTDEFEINIDETWQDYLRMMDEDAKEFFQVFVETANDYRELAFSQTDLSGLKIAS